ncbi:class Ib ribonucleoside-diphosphate reductase assembly flavoprotein NrdI [Sediminivirga luteola]|uniref:Protein NrdI n=1 Tax=Sediminivirga luteola TaxID=1774748 RepID=A0A8J2XL54_9MICO|nr:class Ib ribonucleoside-diphosphate reductase assembly flavoprotein NrdI [Sediminivirga luteola]MCI2266505.1 class Ib ribonucleoside-diphosphate reductase assembly flavoprotein NrdI [Sediminivirga luteola]GGA15213.1 protein NrdI [Sediminivirga luteola]
MTVVYYSSSSNYTHAFAQKLRAAGQHCVRLPLLTKDDTLLMEEPFVLITPTYGAGPRRGAVPKQVIKFLNVPQNRELLCGVIGAGNTNFGETYCQAAHIVAQKCQVPLLYRFELLGLPEDVRNVNEGLNRLWKQKLQRRA